MFRKRTKSDTQTEYTCNVRFLDDEPIPFTFKKDTIGQWLLDRVSERLKLMEKDYFGLRYIDSEKQRHWLDPLKTVYKQMKGVSPMVLCFRVKFYPEEPMKLHEEITRYYMFLQLRRDLHHGRLLCSPDDAVYLAAYIVQSEVGDFHPEDHPPGYISEFKMLPKQTPRLEDRVMEQHRALLGQVPSEAEGNFLKRACCLDTYGVDPHQVKDLKGDQLYLGITCQGIMTFRGSRRTQLYKWFQIRRISYEGKMFIIHINVNEEGGYSGPTKKKQQPVSYKCQNAPGAKYMWRCAVEQQLFFTLAIGSAAPKLRSGGSLFTRGSKFRFSGRSQNEAHEASDRIHRPEPNFPRSSSLPNFARRHGSNRSSAVISHRNSSLLDESMAEESAVDVPSGLTTAAPYQPQILVEGRSIKAPLAPQEMYDEQQQLEQEVKEMELIASTTAVTMAATLPPRLNGQVPQDVAEVSENEDGDVSQGTGVYQPNYTVYEEEEEGEEEEMTLLKTPVQEEMLPTRSNSTHAEQNHVSDIPVPASTAPVAVPTKRSAGCRAFVVSVMVALLLFAAFFYVLFFSGWKHPLLSQARTHLTFLEPARDIVAKHSRDIVTYFSK